MRGTGRRSSPDLLVVGILPVRGWLAFGSLQLLYFMQGKSDDAGRANPDGHCRGDEGARRFQTERVANGEVRDSAEGSGKVAQTRRRRVHPAAANHSEAAQGVHRAIHQGQPAGTCGEGKKGSRADRAISSGGSFGGRNERGDRRSHRGNRRKLDKTNGSCGESGEVRAGRKNRGRQSAERPGAGAAGEIRLTFFVDTTGSIQPASPVNWWLCASGGSGQLAKNDTVT